MRIILASLVTLGWLFASPLSLAAPAGETIRRWHSPERQEWVIETLESGHWIERVIQDSPDPRAFPRLIRRRLMSDRMRAQRRTGMIRTKTDIAFAPPTEAEVVTPVTEVPGEVLWKVENTWDLNWERRYAHWIKGEVGPDFFVKHELATDCADVALSLRWIFARNHRLPVANRLGGVGKWLTQDSMKRQWVTLPTAESWTEDRRFLAALNQLMLLTYTHTLSYDSYPLAITPEFFWGGMHHLQLHGNSGHTYLIHQVDLTNEALNPITVMSSTTPREVRTMMKGGYWNTMQPRVGEGFLRMRWPRWREVEQKWELTALDEHPGYSPEQYAPDFMPVGEASFSKVLLTKLIPGYNPMRRVEEGLRGLVDLLNDRVKVVEEGAVVCATQGCPEGSANYEAWSTPSRDARLLELIGQLQAMVLELYVPGIDAVEFWNQALDRQKIEMRLRGQNEQISLRRVIWHLLVKTFSSDPRESIEMRWGIDPTTLAARMQAEIPTLLNERANRVWADEPCRTAPESCILFSEGWQQRGTVKIDSALLSRAAWASEFCRLARREGRSNHCDQLSALLASMFFEVRGESVSANRLLERFMQFNSDPRVAIEQRWRSVSEAESTVLVKDDVAERFGFLNISQDDLAIEDGAPLRLIQGNTAKGWRLVLLDLKRDVELPAPKGGVWIGLASQSHIALARVDGTIRSELVLFADGRREVARIPWATWEESGKGGRVRLTACGDAQFQLGDYWLDFAANRQGRPQLAFGKIPEAVRDVPLGEFGQCGIRNSIREGKYLRVFADGQIYDSTLKKAVGSDFWFLGTYPTHVKIMRSETDSGGTLRFIRELINFRTGQVEFTGSDVNDIVACGGQQGFLVNRVSGYVDRIPFLADGTLGSAVRLSSRPLSLSHSDPDWIYASTQSGPERVEALFYRCSRTDDAHEVWHPPGLAQWGTWGAVSGRLESADSRIEFFKWKSESPWFVSEKLRTGGMLLDQRRRNFRVSVFSGENSSELVVQMRWHLDHGTFPVTTWAGSGSGGHLQFWNLLGRGGFSNLPRPSPGTVLGQYGSDWIVVGRDYTHFGNPDPGWVVPGVGKVFLVD